jgi:hypothetical protein
MFINLAAGTLVISMTVIIHTFGLIAITRTTAWLTDRVRMSGRRSRVLAMVTVVFGLFAVMTVEVWLWAFAFDLTGALSNFSDSLYFSTVTFSTLGFGDLLAHPEWRLFAALEGIDGFLMIGWSTAYLIAAGTRVGPFRMGEHF